MKFETIEWKHMEACGNLLVSWLQYPVYGCLVGLLFQYDTIGFGA